jgi:NADH:ubiquinone oxidoreductase subunit 4 (subunit M)
MILGGAYSIWFYNRVVFGGMKTPFIFTLFADLNQREFFLFLPFTLAIFFWMGIYPRNFFRSYCVVQ